ncbi:MAG: oligosaccharide flippase family protein [Calditrichota bacterium]
MDMIPGSSYEFYKKYSVHGIKWTGSVEIISRVFNFIITLVLARLLTPQDFGQIALALVGIKFVQLVVDFGVSSAIVQKPQITREHYDTSFTIIILFSIFISLFFTFASNLIAEVLGNSNIASLIKYLSVVIILGGFNIIPRAFLIPYIISAL